MGGRYCRRLSSAMLYASVAVARSDSALADAVLSRSDGLLFFDSESTLDWYLS